MAILSEYQQTDYEYHWKSKYSSNQTYACRVVDTKIFLDYVLFILMKNMTNIS